MILIYGLFADPSTVQQSVASISGIPAGVRDILGQQLANIAGQSSGSLGIGVAISILVALWSSSKATHALI